MTDSKRSVFEWVSLIIVPAVAAIATIFQQKQFSSEGASVEGLNQLYKETQELVDDINKGLSRSFRKLAEARVSY